MAKERVKLYSNHPDHYKEMITDNSIFMTPTALEQKQVEMDVLPYFEMVNKGVKENYALHRKRTINYLKTGLKSLSENMVCLDASRPWLIYWITHALELLEVDLYDETEDIYTFLNNCQNEDGGFGGGPGQISHLAPTYASVCSLGILGTPESYSVIDREALYCFLLRMRTEEGAFALHEGGEVDIRGVYCAVAVANMTNISTPELFKGTDKWILSCQTYEGGFSGAPGLEAHGGYSYCGLAALTLLKCQNSCDSRALLHWAASRQMRFEGGFQGRTNKLVDGCYSFWQGSLFPMLHHIFNYEENTLLSASRWMFCQEALQEYLLFCCQSSKGGMIDKPSKYPDYYHTCYTLSGLSVAQHFRIGKIENTLVVGRKENELIPIDILFNIGQDSARSMVQHFKSLGQVNTVPSTCPPQV